MAGGCMAPADTFRAGLCSGAAPRRSSSPSAPGPTPRSATRYSIRHDDLSAALGLKKARTDLNGGFTFAVRPDVAIYTSVGRTISARDDNSATVTFNAGVSLGFK